MCYYEMHSFCAADLRYPTDIVPLWLLSLPFLLSKEEAQCQICGHLEEMCSA